MTDRQDEPFERLDAIDRHWWASSDSRAVRAANRAGTAVITRAVRDQPRRDRALKAYRSALHRGNRVECPICGSSFRHFAARWNAENVVCWECYSQERHRLIWLFLAKQRPELLREAGSLLHFAPEPGIRERLSKTAGLDYTTCDLDPELGELEIDITEIALPDESFGAIICSHVLEHIPDDRRAMSELFRVLRPGGWLLVLVPIDHSRKATYEDAAVTTPEGRKEHFWQEDHVRVYALDIADRLRGVGFEVEHLRPTEQMSEAEIERYRLGLGNDLFLCRRPTAAAR
jgi:SAM-dependent methyltransferase